MPQVRVIQPISEQAKKLRVAAYARVSSDSADQLNSFATQVAYYTDFIQSKDEWEFAGLYADEEQPHAQQSHDDRGHRQGEGGQGEQDKRYGDQFEYQPYRFNLFLTIFYHAGAEATML